VLLEICNLSFFVTIFILKTFKKSPRKQEKGGNLEDSYSPEISSKILNRRSVRKINFFPVFCEIFFGGEGGDEIKSHSMLSCAEIIPPETVTFYSKLK
jgi:hypothetical protein